MLNKKTVLISKNDSKKESFISSIIQNKPNSSNVIYIYPKNRPRVFKGAFCVTFEDVTKNDNWLTVNGILNEDTILIMENPSRYPKITSTKYEYLYRLAMKVKKENKYIVDIVPFTLDIVYLYTTYVYMSRAILGHAHWYAFRENYSEQLEDGTIVSGHDHKLLAKKIMGITEIDYPQFLLENREIVSIISTKEEAEQYQAKKDELFDKEKSIVRIITRLADTAHAFVSRREAVAELALSLEGKTVIYFNLTSYAPPVKKLIGRNKNIICTSYQKGYIGDVDNIIYAESPIVKSYFLLDAESRANQDAKVYHFVGDMGVDKHLYSLVESELNQINSLTKEMNRA
jgi:uncharacterized protein YhbP (UPF0306 family)